MTAAAATLQRTLATIAVRRWAYDRMLLFSGRVTNYKVEGWKKRATATYDARNVRVADFELALATLPANQQTLILLIHQQGYTWAEASAITASPPAPSASNSPTHSTPSPAPSISAICFDGNCAKSWRSRAATG